MLPGIQTVEGQLTSGPGRYAIIASRWNATLVDHLTVGAVDTLKRHGVSEEQLTLVRCPGAYELPLTAKKLARQKCFRAIIALGIVIRGGTPHFDYVAGECASGLSRVMLDFEVPVSFGILTTDTVEQALERSGLKMGNKGGEAALAALEMVSLLDALEVADG
ncbi:MAG: 6,7-dimethyl-8-ribityllumazine synthase [Kistimonas sp.]|nr:6,7-dimethyl-8-ribityllumazine synthase [Kistimonas sp.]